jgi:hypothetical protein
VKYLIDFEDDEILEIDETDIKVSHDEVYVTDAIGKRPQFNSAGVIRPMSRGTEISIDIIDNTIKSIESLLIDMRVERMTVLENAYRNSHQYVHVLEDGTLEVRDRPKPPVPVSSKYPTLPDEDFE